jgi:hypothetical protein
VSGVIERLPHGFRTRCEQCATLSPLVNAVEKEGACAILRTAGWSFGDRGGDLAYCPKCGTAPASPSSKRRKAERR